MALEHGNWPAEHTSAGRSYWDWALGLRGLVWCTAGAVSSSAGEDFPTEGSRDDTHERERLQAEVWASAEQVNFCRSFPVRFSGSKHGLAWSQGSGPDDPLTDTPGPGIPLLDCHPWPPGESQNSRTCTNDWKRLRSRLAQLPQVTDGETETQREAVFPTPL